MWARGGSEATRLNSEACANISGSLTTWLSWKRRRLATLGSPDTLQLMAIILSRTGWVRLGKFGIVSRKRRQATLSSPNTLQGIAIILSGTGRVRLGKFGIVFRKRRRLATLGSPDTLHLLAIILSGTGWVSLGKLDTISGHGCKRQQL